ncbi:MAG: hypothetical protein ACO236_00435 [Candidatus Nanopelagicaceae bacterium]
MQINEMDKAQALEVELYLEDVENHLKKAAKALSGLWCSLSGEYDLQRRLDDMLTTVETYEDLCETIGQEVFDRYAEIELEDGQAEVELVA